LCGAKTCARWRELASELLRAPICPIAISQYSSRLLTIERKGLTNREVGAQSHGPPGKPVGSRAAETFVMGPKERPGLGLAAGLSRSTVSAPSPGGRADPGVRAPPTRRARAGSHPSERTLDHAPNGTQHASDSSGAHEPAARLPPRVGFRAQGDVRRFHWPVPRNGAGGRRRWCTLARPWGRARGP
jgi:hypothetical protein